MREIKTVKRPGLTYWEAVNVAQKRVPSVPLFLRRNGMWWRANAQGYTSDLAQAGVYSPEYGRGCIADEGTSVVPAADAIHAEIAATEARIQQDHQRLATLRAMLAAPRAADRNREASAMKTPIEDAAQKAVLAVEEVATACGYDMEGGVSNILLAAVLSHAAKHIRDPDALASQMASAASAMLDMAEQAAAMPSQN